jgi:hypothetical protein
VTIEPSAFDRVPVTLTEALVESAQTSPHSVVFSLLGGRP